MQQVRKQKYMSKKKNNQVEETPETDVETTEDVTTDEETSEVANTDVDTAYVAEEPDTNFNYVGNNMANEETYSKAHLYNRNDYPVTINLTDGSQLVLSPRQKTEPIGVILFNQEEIAAVGVLKIDI